MDKQMLCVLVCLFLIIVAALWLGVLIGEFIPYKYKAPWLVLGIGLSTNRIRK